MISKEKFVLIIDSLKAQYDYDKGYAFGLSELIKTDDVVMYHNGILTNTILSLLREHFPKDNDGHCELEHYCYVLNFGSDGDSYENAEELYDRLIGN